MDATCQFSESLTAYLDGELPAEARATLDTHLAGCDACRGELALLRGTLGHIAAAERIEPSADLRRRVLTRLDSPRGLLPRLQRVFRTRFLVPVGAFATVAAMAAVVVAVQRTHATRRTPVEIDVASHLDLLEDYDVISAVDVPPGTTAEDVDVVEHLDELMK